MSSTQNYYWHMSIFGSYHEKISKLYRSFSFSNIIILSVKYVNVNVFSFGLFRSLLRLLDIISCRLYVNTALKAHLRSYP